MEEQMSEVKYPKITVRLVGTDGNAFAILGTVRKALKKAGVSQEQIDEFTTDATMSTYDHLLQTCMQWVNIE
jgi:uncharacterized protein